jgi:hypothetical protein
MTEFLKNWPNLAVMQAISKGASEKRGRRIFLETVESG